MSDKFRVSSKSKKIKKIKKMKESLSQYKEQTRKLKNKFKEAKKQLMSYEVGLFICNQVTSWERSLNQGLDEESCKARMLELYENADENELKVDDPHYKAWLNIIYFSRLPIPGLNKLRDTMFEEGCKRRQYDEFCFSMSVMSNLFHSRVFPNRTVLPRIPIKEKLVIKSLRMLVDLHDHQIKSIVKFLKAFGYCV